MTLLDWTDNWKDNESKIFAMLFAVFSAPEPRGRVYLDLLALALNQLGRNYLLWSPEVKYLDNNLSRRLTCRTHPRQVTKRVSARLDLLFPVLANTRPCTTFKLGKLIVSTSM